MKITLYLDIHQGCSIEYNQRFSYATANPDYPVDPNKKRYKFTVEVDDPEGHHVDLGEVPVEREHDT